MSTRAVACLASALLLFAAAVPASAGTLDRARAAGKLKIGYRTDARPFSYRDESGKGAGYSVDLCRKIADAAGLRVELVPVSSGERFRAVKEGRIDLLCGAATVTLARRKDVAFSLPIFPGGVGALLRTDAPARMRAILSGEPEPHRPRWRASLGQILQKRTFAVHAGTTAETWLDKELDELKIIAEVDPVDDYQEGVERVVSRRADVLFGDRAILLDTATRSPSADDLVVLDRHFTSEPLALALQRGDEDFRLLVDRTLSALYESGELAEIYLKFFGEPDETALLFFQWTTLPE